MTDLRADAKRAFSVQSSGAAPSIEGGVLLAVREGSKTESARQRITLGDGSSGLLRIPPGVAHLGATTARVWEPIRG